MANNIVRLPLDYFGDPTTGKPVSNGSVFIGLPDLDPEIEANRKTVTLRQEDGTEVPILPAGQPLVTGSGGYILFEGSNAQVLTDGNYSIKVLNSSDSQVYFVENALDGVPLTSDEVFLPHDIVADMIADTSLSVGDTVKTKGYTSIGDGGDNEYDIVAAGTGADDGGQFIDLVTHQAKGNFPRGVYTIEQFGLSTTASDSVNSAAILAAIASNAGRISTGSGSFPYDEDIVIDRAIIFEGSGSCQDNGQPGPGTTEFVYTGTGIGIDLVGSAGNGVENIHLRDFMLEGNTSAIGGIAIGTGVLVTKSSIKNVHIGRFRNPDFEKGYGVRFAGCLEMTFDNFYTQGNFDGMVNYDDDVATTLNFNNSYSRSNSRYGFIASGTDQAGHRQFASINLRGLVLESNVDAGLVLFGSSVADVDIYDLHVENNNTGSGLAPIILDGIDITKVITDISNDNPGVVTTEDDHGFLSGELLDIDSALGMTEVNDLDLSVGATLTPTTFELLGVDTTVFTPYSGGGNAVVDRSVRDITFYSLKGAGGMGLTCFTPNNSDTATEVRYLKLDFAKDIVLHDPTFVFQKKNNSNLTINTFMEVTANTGTLVLNQTTQGNQIKALDTIVNASNIKGSDLNRRTIVNGLWSKQITVTMTSGTGTITLGTDNKLTKTMYSGNRVQITGQIIVDSVSSPTGGLFIEGIPVVDKLVAAKAVDSCASGFHYDNLSGGNNFIAIAEAGGTAIRISEFTGGSVVANTAARVQAGSELTVNVTYFTDEVD